MAIWRLSNIYMRYLIVRRWTIRVLLLVSLVAAFASVVPWIYENVFVREEAFFDDGVMYQDLDSTWIWRGITGIDKDIFLDSSFLNNDYVFSKLKIEDADLKGVKVSADIIVKGQLIRDKEGKIIGFSGKLFSRDIVLNSKSFDVARMSFRIIENELEVETLRLGNSYGLKGRLSLVPPFETYFRVEIMRADMREVGPIAKIKNSNVMLGIVKGFFHIKGNLSNNLFSEGILESRNGKIGLVGYDLATVRFEGFGPIINIVDSSIGNGALTMEGYIDLRDISEGDLFDGLKIKSDVKTIVWDDWDITKKGTDKLSMTKDISDNMRVGFKTMAREPFTTYYDTERPEEMSLEYKIGSEENIKMRLRENDNFFGVEHSVKF